MGANGFFFLLLLLTLISLFHNFHVCHCARHIVVVEQKSSYPSSSFSSPPPPPPASTSSVQQLPLQISKSDGNYVVTVGLGTPTKYLNLMLDTGSATTWVQCRQGTTYNPNSSTTSSTPCSTLQSCTFEIKYLDGSYSNGYKATDKFTISNHQFPSFAFGCAAEKLDDESAKVDGILALGPPSAKEDVPPLLSQTAQIYRTIFCYCLPTAAGNSGYLLFGSQAIQTCQTENTRSTTIVPNTTNPAMYFVNLNGITIGDLVIPASSLSSAAIDSGTEISRLPQEVYEGVKAEFKKWMANYTEVEGSDILDTCYDMGGVEIKNLKVPIMVLHFGDELDMYLNEGKVVWPDKARSGVACLGFAADNVSIIGTHQHSGWNLLYNNERNTVAFGPGNC